MNRKNSRPIEFYSTVLLERPYKAVTPFYFWASDGYHIPTIKMETWQHAVDFLVY